MAEEQWRALTALLGDPARKPPRGAYTLLGGLARCRCGNKVAAGTNATGRQVYRCDPADPRGPARPALPADDRQRGSRRSRR